MKFSEKPTAQEIASAIDSMDIYQRKAFLILIRIAEYDEFFLKLPPVDLARIYALIRDELKAVAVISDL